MDPLPKPLPRPSSIPRASKLPLPFRQIPSRQPQSAANRAQDSSPRAKSTNAETFSGHEILPATDGLTTTESKPRKSRTSLSDCTVDSLSWRAPPPSPNRRHKLSTLSQQPTASSLKASPAAVSDPRNDSNAASKQSNISGVAGARRPETAKRKGDSRSGHSKQNKGSPHVLKTAFSKKDALPSGPEMQASPKSSATLRQTIARAKAAHRAIAQLHDQENHQSLGLREERIETQVDPRNNDVMKKRISVARTEGRLNIAAMGLRDLPPELLTMYDLDVLDDLDGSWAESVDLVKFCAADNEISLLDDKFFPDRTVVTEADDEVNCSSVLAALETLDFHGNQLTGLPPRLANLRNLAALNLSRNRLDHHSLTVIASISTLRELRLAENNLFGNIDEVLSVITKLELLDLSNNGMTSFEGIDRLLELRVLLLSGNRLTALPEGIFELTNMRELNVSKNALKGNLIPQTPTNTVSLRSLNASSNALTCLTEEHAVDFPNLQCLEVGENRLKSVPILSNCPKLTTLVASGNQLTEIPSGLTDLAGLKNVDLSFNDIRRLDPRLGLMDLTVFSIANNPIIERRLVNMNTEDLKSELRERLTQDAEGKIEHEQEQAGQQVFKSMGQGRALDSHGILDWSNRDLSDIKPQALELMDQAGPTIRSLILKRNNFANMPTSIELIATSLTTIDFSHNKFHGNAYLARDIIQLDNLKLLNMSANTITSLEPLISKLAAPSLFEIDVSRNRIQELPNLRDTFPALRYIKASDNRVQELPFKSVQGLHFLDVSSNDIRSLEPRIGLLAQEGLRTLLVGANTFRVPRREVVEKGTEAILNWLRFRIPEA